MNRRDRIDSDPELVCPECGQVIAPDAGPAHAEHHWPSNTPPQFISKEAIERRDKVRAGGVPRDETP